MHSKISQSTHNSNNINIFATAIPIRLSRYLEHISFFDLYIYCLIWSEVCYDFSQRIIEWQCSVKINGWTFLQILRNKQYMSIRKLCLPDVPISGPIDPLSFLSPLPLQWICTAHWLVSILVEEVTGLSMREEYRRYCWIRQIDT